MLWRERKECHSLEQQASNSIIHVRPRSTPRWHMRRIHDHKHKVVRVLGVYPDALPEVVDLVRGVDAHNGPSAIGYGE